MRRASRLAMVALLAATLSVTASCGTDEAPAGAAPSLTVAAVDNGDLDRLRDLSQTFLDEHPGVTIDWVRHGENELREVVSTDVGTGGGRFDVVTIGTYEAQIWAGQKLLTPLTGMPAGFDPQAFLPTVAKALSADSELQAAPFYGESAFTMYRTDLFQQAGVTMPERPTWQFLIDTGSQIAQATGVDGMCVRGKAGWGENMALVSAMAHSYGARWFDENWQPQLNSPEWAQATDDYLRAARLAPQGVADAGFQENLALFQQGKCAIWVDATSAGSFVVDPKQSTVATNVGFAPAPQSPAGRPMTWLWSWALAVPEKSDHKDLAKEFVAWATSTQYRDLVAARYGWGNVPPGTRADLYDNPQYRQAAPYADLVRRSIEAADVTQPTTAPVPYEGIQYVAIAPFQSIGTAVGQQLTNAIRGETSAQEALENSQWVADRVIDRTRRLEEQEK